MRRFLTITAALVALLTTAIASEAGIFVPIVSVTGSASTEITGINDNDIIVGAYLNSDGSEHSFFGTLSGNYTTFDAPAGNTEARAISNDGTITGFANNDGAPGNFIPFERTTKGKIKTVVSKKGNALNYIAQGIANSNDEFAGSYLTKRSALLGYLARDAQYKEAVKLSIQNTGVAPRALNSAGDIVGWYSDIHDIVHGFLVSGGVATTIDYPNKSQLYTELEGINDEGTLTGNWEDSDGIIHAFKYDIAGGTFTSIDVPHSTMFSRAWAVNNAGIVAVDSDQGAFIYCPNKKTCPGAGAKSNGVEIHAVLKDLPHAACVNGCLAPFKNGERATPPVARIVTRVAAGPSGKAQPMLP